MERINKILTEINRDKVSNIRVITDITDFIVIENPNGVGCIRINPDGEHINLPELDFAIAAEELHDMYYQDGKTLNIIGNYYIER